MTTKQLKDLRHIWVTLNQQRNVLHNIDEELTEEPEDDLDTAIAGLDAVASKMQRFIEYEEAALRNKGAAR